MDKGTIKTVKRESVFNTVVCVPWWWNNKDFNCNIGDKEYFYRVKSLSCVDHVTLSLWIV